MSSALEPKHLPVPGSDDSLYEVIHGERVECIMSAESTMIATRLVARLFTYVEEHRLGHVAAEMLFVLDEVENEKRRPDVSFVSKATWPLDQRIPPHGDWKIVPDLAIEVISPNDNAGQMLIKVGEYFQFGVKEVWVVYPESQIVHVYQSMDRVKPLKVGDTLQSSGLLPGWTLPVAKLFE